MLPFIVQRLTWWTTLKDTESKRYVGMSPAPWPQPMCFILPQLDIRGVPVLKLRKATGKLVHHGSLHCVACHHEVADSIERLIQVFDLDEKPFQDNVYTVSTSQTNWSETNSNYIDIYSRQTRKHQQTHTHRECHPVRHESSIWKTGETQRSLPARAVASPKLAQ